MRTKNVLRNSIYSVASYLLIFGLGVINRKIFLEYLSVEFLGYESLFSNIFSVLSLAELGIGAIITYSMYQEIVSDNEQQITKLMMMYKHMYRMVGMFVASIGLALLPFLKHIITDNDTNWDFVRIIFVLQLSSALCTYFLSYRRVIYSADQKQFICIQVDTIINIVSQIFKILILIVLKNYIIYLLISIIGNILSNVIIAYKCKKDYPYIKRTKITRKDYLERGFLKDIKNFMIHKISYVVYSGIDNIVISIFIGIIHVGLLSNYMLIFNQITNLLSRMIIQPVSSSIGNLIYSENKEKGEELLFAFNLMTFILSAFVSISYMVLFQPVMQLWLGREYLLSISLVFMLSVNSYIRWSHNVFSIYREAFGEYERDKKYMMASAVIKIVLSVILVKTWGLTGVIFGTVVGHMIIIYGRIRFIFTVYIKGSCIPYIKKHLFLSLLVLLEGGLTYYLASFIPISISGVLGKIILCLVIPNTINILIFHKTKDFKIIKVYLSQILIIFTNKLKKKSM